MAMQAPPKLKDLMSLMTHTIGDDQPMSEASRRMAEFDIRHLPVLRGGRIVGLVSERDLAVISGFPGVDPDEVPVSEAMTADPYVAAPELPIRDVLEHMRLHKHGCVIAEESGAAVGIFTTFDALSLALDALG